MASKKIAKAQSKAVQSAFNEWTELIEKETILHKSVDSRMGYVLTGLKLGVEPSTVLNICRIDDDDLLGWLDNNRNRVKWERALSYGDAQLESYIYDESFKNPYLALAYLKERKKGRLNFVSEKQKAPSKRSLSEMLEEVVEGEVV